ncbi:hypothetical protein Lalb_Chr18g0055641 [Lupinus albus]|uniref:Uncharacterized protein n=1 Tax=Lupinus albus TaxID=3870 RepID=A0A6A4NZL1_LUPAL|nr:hypothetical protein Lalb_Chr18g0055641 [Lupinus albus]
MPIHPNSGHYSQLLGNSTHPCLPKTITFWFILSCKELMGKELISFEVRGCPSQQVSLPGIESLTFWSIWGSSGALRRYTL